MTTSNTTAAAAAPVARLGNGRGGGRCVLSLLSHGKDVGEDEAQHEEGHEGEDGRVPRQPPPTRIQRRVPCDTDHLGRAPRAPIKRESRRQSTYATEEDQQMSWRILFRTGAGSDASDMRTTMCFECTPARTTISTDRVGTRPQTGCDSGHSMLQEASVAAATTTGAAMNIEGV